MTEHPILAYPMHGIHKMLVEGFRTRDAHLIEWFARLNAAGVDVMSRPEPIYLKPFVDRDVRASGASIPRNMRDFSKSSWTIPNPRDRRSWWVQTKRQYRVPNHASAPAIVWNPMIGLSNIVAELSNGRALHFDLLDNWLEHQAFTRIRSEVEAGYKQLFRVATSVTANGEGTLELARSFGRDDAELLPNGVDPERFSNKSRANGALTVGYVGKIGFRLDLAGILRTAQALPDVSFVFAGPILDAEYRAPLAAQPNVQLLGDVRYDDVPALLETFDVGWVPHGVGNGSEVGGDVIKIYEYRAAGLPTVTTPVSGARDRGIEGVTVAPLEEHQAILAAHRAHGPRVLRNPVRIPTHATWTDKAQHIIQVLSSH